ncbi:hypothetical protein AB0I73_41065, partial [Streptomyces sp. NPDC050388]
GLRPDGMCGGSSSSCNGGTETFTKTATGWDWLYTTTSTQTVTYQTVSGGTGTGTTSITVRTEVGHKSAQIVFKKGPNPEPERKDGKKGPDGDKTIDLSAEELVALWARGGPKEITLPPDGEFVRQLRTEDHFRSFTRMVQRLIRDGVYQAAGDYDKKNSERSEGEMFWEKLTDATGFFTAGIYGASPASLALGSYNLDYKLLGVACRPPQANSEWDRGALVGQVKVEVSNDMTRASAARSSSGDGYAKGSSDPS